MCPRAPILDIPDKTLGDAIMLSDCALAPRIFADFKHLPVSQFGEAMPCAISAITPALRHPVGIVIGNGEKVIDIYAGAHITFVADGHLGWNRAMLDFPRYSVSKFPPIIPANPPIPAWAYIAAPDTTAIRHGLAIEGEPCFDRTLARGVFAGEYFSHGSTPMLLRLGTGRTLLTPDRPRYSSMDLAA